MLTKEHLKFRVRTGRAYPIFCDVADRAALATASELIELFDEASQRNITFGELTEAAEGVTDGPFGAALQKLLFDACEEKPEDESIEDFRWQCLLQAEGLRRDVAPASAGEFQTLLARACENSFDKVRDRLYGDLPACRVVAGFKKTSAEALLHRFNLAQVQGLILRARRVVIKIKNASLAERRLLFRQIKFHRLLCEVKQDSGQERASGILELEVNGPLSIFEQASTYGLRLAKFLPHLMHLSHWELTAEILFNKRELILKVDQSTGLVSHYRKSEPYIPEELGAFVEAFNQRNKGWQASPGEEFVHIGRESYCFPDLTISSQDGTKRSIELFHRWHAGQLAGRLKALEISPVQTLIIGVSRSLAGRPEIAQLIAASSWFGKNGFIFSEFPTPKNVLAVLDRA